MNWQLIETVPLCVQGTSPETVLLYGPRFGVQVGTVARFPDGEILSHVNGFSGNWPVSHWMPLPAPPNSEQPDSADIALFKKPNDPNERVNKPNYNPPSFKDFDK